MTTAELILEVLPRYRYAITNEYKTQLGIAEVLALHEIAFVREHVEGGDRFDFLCGAGVVIEVKRDGSYSEALRQAERYCQSRAVETVILATTKGWPRDAVSFNGKPVHVVHLPGPRL